MAKKPNNTGVPQYKIEALARCLLPEIQKFFESEEGQREFTKWKKFKHEKSKNKCDSK